MHAVVLDNGQDHLDGTRVGGGPVPGQADGHGGPDARDGVGVADDADALELAADLDADGVQRVAAGAPAAVDGADEPAQLGVAGLGADDPEGLADGVEGGQDPVGGQGVGADRLVAEELHLLERGRQALGRGREAPVDVAGGQDADLGGQVGQVGVLRRRTVGGQEAAQRLGGGALAQDGAGVALQPGRQDFEEPFQGEIAVVELHEAIE